MNLLFWLAIPVHVPCFDCKHFVPMPNLEHGKCAIFLKYVDIVRSDETKCGKEGKFFTHVNKKKEYKDFK
jgi:hypothetical protein